eukprot:CAMPEP_0194122676 /NCGR_PEP_ID=MMETSP0150-20130528/51523_1 /TAXON_ID=122233 /ORGANISM="Chaetoceros debilis, Strain MM31A-1" /LENGTH=52 /DNA_ID=CAMNT_0038815625 /DNA_START=80 /DNA_END=241 /DNA_ORIENTATION=-
MTKPWALQAPLLPEDPVAKLYVSFTSAGIGVVVNSMAMEVVISIALMKDIIR